MNNPTVFSALFILTSAAGSIAAPGDLFDSPGPGYREQIERVLGPKAPPKDAELRVRFAPNFQSMKETKPSPPPLDSSGILFKPIRLFDTTSRSIK